MTGPDDYTSHMFSVANVELIKKALAVAADVWYDTAYSEDDPNEIEKLLALRAEALTLSAELEGDPS